MPPIGNQPVRAARNTRNSDVSSGGIDSRNTDVDRTTPGSRPPRCAPVSTPSGSPPTVASRRGVTASVSVLAAPSAINSATGRPLARDRPKSNRIARDNHSAYCTVSGRSRPSRWRRPAICSTVALGPSCSTAKSPGASSTRTRAADETANTRNAANARRLARYLVIVFAAEARRSVCHPDRIGRPQELRAQDCRLQAGDARGRRREDPGRGEVQDGNVLGEELLDLVERFLAFGLVER